MRARWVGLIALTIATGQAAEAAEAVCNGMSLDLSAITLTNDHDSYTVPAGLKPGECARLPELGAGAYGLQFIESDGKQVASCRNQVILRTDAPLVISPDDGASCMM